MIPLETICKARADGETTMNDAGFGVFLTNLGRYNEGDLVGRWYGLEDFPLAYDRVARDIELDEMHEEYFITDRQGCPQDMGEYVSLNTLNELAEWISGQIGDGLSEKDVCTVLEAVIDLQQIVDDSIDELRFYPDMHTTKEIAQEVWDCTCSQYQEAIDSWGLMGEFVAFDAAAYGDYLETECEFVDTESGIFQIIYL